jgi:hypothetical protein
MTKYKARRERYDAAVAKSVVPLEVIYMCCVLVTVRGIEEMGAYTTVVKILDTSVRQRKRYDNWEELLLREHPEMIYRHY